MVRVNRIEGYLEMLENRMAEVRRFAGDYLQDSRPASEAWHRLLAAVREARGMLLGLEHELAWDIQEPEED